MGAKDIDWLHMLAGYGLLLLPLVILLLYRSQLIATATVSVIRMSLQLILVGFYLTFLFEYSSNLLNALWLLVMLAVSAYTVVRRSELVFRVFIFPVATSLLFSLVITLFLFLYVVLELPNVFSARYLIPIAGMILGNCLQNSIIGLRNYYHSLDKSIDVYQYYLALGATPPEAQKPFLRKAMQEA